MNPDPYKDPYLANLVTPDREERAIADVAALGRFSGDFAERLTVIRAYVITCIECQASPDDLFVQKLKHYQREYDATLVQARASTPKADGSFTFFSIGLGRA